jgi:hypothetical protein
MIDFLEELHKCAVGLRRIGMIQSAGDYDYLVTWLRSPEFNNGEHLPPHPAGKNTVDDYSNNCPIPFTPDSKIVKQCTDSYRAEQLIQSARDIITELSNVYTEDIEQTALSTYLEYSNNIIVLLGGEALSPEQPVGEFGEIIPVFFSTNGTESQRISLMNASVQAYDSTGNPVYVESNWIYKSSENTWDVGYQTTSVLATIYTFPNALSSMAYLGDTAAGSEVRISTSDFAEAMGAYLFRAKESFYFAWLYPNGVSGSRNISPDQSSALYLKGSSENIEYSRASQLKLRAVLGKNAEFLDISTLEITDYGTSSYTYLKNNGATPIDAYCVIFSD